MSTKIIVIGDPHIRIEEELYVRHYFNSIEQLLDQVNPDLIIILGDVLHNHEKIHSSSMNLAYTFFHLCRKRAHTFCLVGNHDAINNQIFLTDDHWMNGCKEWEQLTIVDKPIVYQHPDGLRLCLLPYVPDGRFKDALLVTDGWKTSHLLFSHQLFNGCQMGPIIASDVEEYEDDYPLCFNGHIHSYQKVKHNLICIGSSRPVGYADTQSKKVMCITATMREDSSCKCKLKEYPIDNLVKKVITCTVSQTDQLSLSTHSDIKYVIKGTSEELKSFKRGKLYKELVDNHIPYQLKIEIQSEKGEVHNTNVNKNKEVVTFFERLYQNIQDNQDLIAIYKELNK